MDKEKILRQLEDKLLPSVQNLDKGQASEHDFLPSLLWMLLEKNKDSENQLKASISANREGFKQTANYIVTKNQSAQNETNQVIDKNIETLYKKLVDVLTKNATQIITENQSAQNEASQVNNKNIETLYKKLVDVLTKNVTQIITENQSAQNEANQEITKLQKQIDNFFDIQKSQEIKISKHLKWLLGFCIFQFVVLTALMVFILMR